MLPVLASGIDNELRPNTFPIFAKSWSTARMTNSAMSLPLSLRTAMFPTPSHPLFNCPTAGPKGSVGRRFLDVEVSRRVMTPLDRNTSIEPRARRHQLFVDGKANLSSWKGFAIAAVRAFHV